jgi:hypothetical protein
VDIAAGQMVIPDVEGDAFWLGGEGQQGWNDGQRFL